MFGMDNKIINLLCHAKYRYATRLLKMNFKDEKAYKDWSKKPDNHEEDIKRIHNPMFNSFKRSELIYEGKLGDQVVERKYYVDFEEMMTYVVDMNGEDVITCWNVFFDMSEDVDRQTAKIIYKEIKKLQDEKEKNDKKIKKEMDVLDFEIENTEDEIRRVQELLDNLSKKKANLIDKKDILQKENFNVDYQIEKLSHKLCYCIELRQDLRSA